MTTDDAADMRRAIETHAEGHARQERLRAAARRVCDDARPDPDDPNRMIISREAIAALDAVLAEV